MVTLERSKTLDERHFKQRDTSFSKLSALQMSYFAGNLRGNLSLELVQI